MAKPKDISNELKAFDIENKQDGQVLAGIDEAGRGPLAGPVVCACVVFSDEVVIPYVNDSKKLSEKRRNLLFDEINEKALSVSVGICDQSIIDDINILNATKKAMREAINSLSLTPDILFVDAVNIDGIDIPQKAIIKGDAKSFSIAAASIIAKVTRDRMMIEFDSKYPGYSFSSHKGYGTKAHYEALRKLGPCEIHRKTFLKTLH